MAIILCSECGGKLSDTAMFCPHCGIPTQQLSKLPNTTQHQEKQEDSHEIGIETSSLRCPNCGGVLQSKDMIGLGLARCPLCNQKVLMSDTNNKDQINEKIYPFGASKEIFHKKCMEILMSKCPADIYSEMSNIEVKQKYIWTREFANSDKEREFYPLNEYGLEFFKKFGHETLSVEECEKWWPSNKMQDLSIEIIQDKDLLPKQITNSECKYKYNKSKNTCYKQKCNSTNNYYCFPIYEESFEYKGETFRFQGVGNDNISEIINIPELPIDKELITQPEYNYGNGYLDLVVAIVILAMMVYDGVCRITEYGRLPYSECGIGYIICRTIWYTFGGAIIIIILCNIISRIKLDYPFRKIEYLLVRRINKKKREKFFENYNKTQSRKQSDAKNVLGIDISIPKLPEYPIPRIKDMRGYLFFNLFE